LITDPRLFGKRRTVRYGARAILEVLIELVTAKGQVKSVGRSGQGLPDLRTYLHSLQYLRVVDL